MNTIYDNKKPIRATLREMEVGDCVEFPKSRTSVIRSTTSTLGLEMDRKYSSRFCRETMTINVIRIY